MWGVHNEFQVPILSSSWKFRVARCTLNYSSAPIGIGNEAAETGSQYPDPRFVAYLNAAQSPTFLAQDANLPLLCKRKAVLVAGGDGRDVPPGECFQLCHAASKQQERAELITQHSRTPESNTRSRYDGELLFIQ